MVDQRLLLEWEFMPCCITLRNPVEGHVFSKSICVFGRGSDTRPSFITFGITDVSVFPVMGIVSFSGFLFVCLFLFVLFFVFF